MADDLAASLARAITTAAVRAAGNHASAPIETVRDDLAAELRDILNTSLPDWYAGYEAGCREQSAIEDRRRHTQGMDF